MNIILIANHLAKPKTLTLLHIISFLVLLVAISVSMTILLMPSSDGGFNGKLPKTLHIGEERRQDHIDALALQLGEIQARVMRLDALSDRLSKLAGVKDTSPPTTKSPGRGGPEVRANGLTESQLEQNIATLTAKIEDRTDYLSALEAKLLLQSTEKNARPTSYPVAAAYNSSSYGWRLDPFTGHNAFHEGLDFTAETGTPIHASADGIVTTAEQTADYGKIIKINHGSGIETRYAHTSQMLVKVGDRVLRGQKIALVGNTGRSTGSHLHFEVRLNGEPLDPRKYLQIAVIN